MSNLKAEYLLSQYEKIYNLGSKDSFTTDLVIQKTTRKLYVMKTMDVTKAPIYECLLKHSHPNLVKIFEVIRTEQACITVEEYIGGFTLNQILTESGPLSQEMAGNYIFQLCMALKHIHYLNIIHRDIQPNNILVSTDGYVKLIDFDISRTPKQNRSKDTTILGTVGYAAPEQFGFSQTDARADIYSLGVLMNVMFTGQLPNEQIYTHPMYQNIILKCTSIDVMNRYQSVEQLLYSLPSAKHPEPPNLLPEKIHSSPPSPYQKWKARYHLQKERYKLSSDAPAALRILRSIPGFRTGFPWKIIVACIMYPTMLYIIYEQIIEFTAFAPIYLIRQILYMILNMLIPFIMWTNLGNIDERLPLLRSMDKKQARIFSIGFGIACLFIGIFLETDLRELLGIPTTK